MSGTYRSRKAPGAVDYIARGLAKKALDNPPPPPPPPSSGVTLVDSGFGLTGGPITSTGTLAVQPSQLDPLYDNREYASYIASPIQDSEVIVGFLSPYSATIPENLVGWQAYVTGTLPTATVVFDVSLNSTNFGTISVSTAGVITMSSATTTSVAADDRITIVAPINMATIAPALNLFITAKLTKA